mgnify:FL=1
MEFLVWIFEVFLDDASSFFFFVSGSHSGLIVERDVALQEELKNTGKALMTAQVELAVARSAALATKAVDVASFQLLVERRYGVDGTGLQGAAQSLAAQLWDSAALLFDGLPDPSD